MRTWRASVDRAVEPLCLALAAAWTLWFFRLQLVHVTDPYWLEWDARAHTLPAWRYHGTGLFPNDLLVDFANIYDPPGVKLVYFIGTLFANPLWLSKLLPFALAPIVVWQSYAAGRALGGRVLGAAAVVLVLHCQFVWGRIVGLDARAFGFPLILSFLRYTLERRERPALAVLLAATLFYPSAFLVCAPAYAVTLLADWRLDRRWLRYALVLAVALVVFSSMRRDPRIGHPITLGELSTLAQRGIVGMWPQPRAVDVMQQAVRVSLYEDYGAVRWLRHSRLREDGIVLGAVAIALGLMALRRWRRIRVPIALVALALGSLAAFAVAQALPYRLYIPGRMLQYAWPPLLLFGLLQLGFVAFSAFIDHRKYAALAAAVVLVVVELGFYGDGLSRDIELHNWRGRDDATVRFLATLPKDVTIAAGFDKSSAIETFARRQTLFSAILNTPIYYPMGLELERRITDYYRAYYARDFDPIRQLRDGDHVDYLVVDTRDFGRQAWYRAEYLNWTKLARAAITAGPPDQLVWSRPPAEAVVFASGSDVVIDLRKLAR